MASRIRGLLGVCMLLAGLVTVAPTAAQADDCAVYGDPSKAQVALDLNPALAPGLDPDGNGRACDHGAAGSGAAGAQLTSATDLDGRLAGSAAAFAGVHGLPIEEIPSDSNPAVMLRAYEPPASSVDLFTLDLDDRVFIIVLVAETAWTPDEAAALAEAYLPADVTGFGEPVSLADGSVLLPAFSDHLATGMDVVAMSASGSTGEPGDLYLLLELDDAGNIVQMEISTGTGDNLLEDAVGLDDLLGSDGSGTGGTTTSTLSAEEQTFLTDTRAEVDRLLGQIADLRLIIESGTFTDAEIDRMAGIVGDWMDLDTALPPAPTQHAAMAQQLQSARSDLSVVGFNLLLLITAPDSADVDETARLLDAAEETLESLDRELTALGV